MSANFNRVILAGNLTRDPQLSYTAGNTPVCKFGLATNRKFRDRDNNTKEEVCFVDLTAFGKPAEIINQYMGKGRSILVEGRLHYHQWTDKEGKNRTKLEVIVENFTFLGDRQGGGAEGGGGAQRGGYNRAAAGGGRPAAAPAGDDEPPIDDAPPPSDADIPF
jgi:single-strand DNA-binding protein